MLGSPNLVPRAFSSTIFKMAILKIVEEKALGTRLGIAEVLVLLNWKYRLGSQDKTKIEHRTGIVEVTGLNPVEALIFFQASFFQLLKLENLLR